MGQANLLLLLGLASLAYIQGCTFKENAQDLISVGYHTDGDGNTAVDKIEVKMKDRGKFDNLMDGCKRPRSKEIVVQYRTQGEGEEGWKKGGTKTLSSKRPFNLENLNPCEKYEVKVTVNDEPLNVFEIGPFYDGDHGHAYLHEEQDNENYQAYDLNPLNHIKVISGESSANISVSGFCARTIVLEVQAEGEEGDAGQLLLQNDLKNPGSKLEKLEKLKPCTKYRVTLDLYLNEQADLDAAAESNEIDYVNQNFATFYTMPTIDGLNDHDLPSFDPETRNLTWDFSHFFDQACANTEPTDIENFKVTLMKGKDEEEVGVAGSMALISECDEEFSLLVEYDKQERSWSRKKTVWNQLLTRTSIPTEETVIIENEHLVLTTDNCLADPDIVELVPLSAADQAEAIQLTPEELCFRMKPVSEVGWMGCLDYTVQVHRSGKVDQLNQLTHPGWKTALDGINMDVSGSTNDSVELEKPAIFWTDGAIKMKVVCNGSLVEGELDTVEVDFEVDEPLELTGLMSDKEYECEARLFKDDGSSSGWSDVWSAHTLETGEEEEIVPEETSTVIEIQEELDNVDDPFLQSVGDPDSYSDNDDDDDDDDLLKTAPQVTHNARTAGGDASSEKSGDESNKGDKEEKNDKSSGNLNIGSFLSVVLASTALLLTNHF